MEQTNKLKIVIGINSLVQSQWAAYNNHLQLFYRLGRDNPDIDLVFVNPNRVGIDRMRNTAAAVTVNEKFDYLLFIDDDVLVPSDCLKRLIAVDADITAADVCIRSYPFDHMCFRWDSKAEMGMTALSSYGDEAGKVIDVDAVGFSCCLIKRSLLEQVPKPYFITGMHNTEDVYFCIKAREINREVSIKVDTSIGCHHILWEQTIGSENKTNMKKYMEDQFPELYTPCQLTTFPIERVTSDTNYEDVVRKEIFNG